MDRKEYMKKYNKEAQIKMPKSVKSAYAKKYYQKNKEKIAERVQKYYAENREQRLKIARKCHLKKKFGISEEYYNDILKKQGGVCAICGSKKKIGGKSLAVDHCHKTNINRGILCFKCNQGLGYFNDSVELLEKSIKYLKNYVSK